MAELTLEQKRALAIAQARKRLKDAQSSYDVRDMTLSMPSGIASGAAKVIGAPGDVMQGIQDYTGIPLRDIARMPVFGGAKLPTSDSMLNLPKQLGIYHEPQTSEGKTTFGVSEGVGGALVGGAGGLVPRLVQGVGAGAGAEIGERVTGGPIGRIAGGVLGGMGTGLLARGITPYPQNQSSAITAARTQAAETLKKQGIKVTAGQELGSRSLKYIESELGGLADDFNTEQAEDFTAAVMRSIGSKSRLATGAAISKASDDIGTMFDDAADLVVRPITNPNASKILRGVLKHYEHNTPIMAKTTGIKVWADDLTDALTKGMTGTQYKNFRSDLSHALANGDRYSRDAHAAFIKLLDDSIEGSISPNAAQSFSRARQLWRDFLVVSKAAVRGGSEGRGLKTITPSALQGAAKSIYGEKAYAKGLSELGKLGDAGAAVMTPMPQSGTNPRQFATKLAQAGGALLGGGGSLGYTGGDVGGAITGVGGAVGGYMLGPLAAGQAIMSPLGQAYLRNQAIRTPWPVLQPGLVGGISTRK